MSNFNHLKLKNANEPLSFEKWNGLVDQLAATELKIPDNENGEILNRVTVGTKPDDGKELNYPWAFETIGVEKKEQSLRLQSPNSIILHTGIGKSEADNKKKVRLTIDQHGDMYLGEDMYIHSGGNKVIGYNNYWNRTAKKMRTIKKGFASELRFTPEGSVHIRRGKGGSKNAETNVEFSLGQLIVGNAFSATISGSGSGNSLFATNLYIDRTGAKDAYKPVGTHTNKYGYAAMRAAWGELSFYTNRVNTTAGKAINIDSSLRLKITPTGLVGIGTPTPQSHLHIKGDGSLINVEGKHTSYFQFYPLGFAKKRQAWLGFGSKGGKDFSIRNERTGGRILLYGQTVVIPSAGERGYIVMRSHANRDGAKKILKGLKSHQLVIGGAYDNHIYFFWKNTAGQNRMAQIGSKGF